MRFGSWLVVGAAVALSLLAYLLIFNANPADFFMKNNSEKVALTASDSVPVVGTLYGVKEPAGWLLLTHMMPATKESWQNFADTMRQQGYESLAIDLRGHGKSAGGPNGYAQFSDAEHQASIHDLEAGWDFLKSRGAVPEKTAFVGASIGANLSLQAAVAIPVKNIILLSPGLNYRGILTLPLAKQLKNSQSLLVATSKDDDANAVEARQLFDRASALNKHLVIFDNGGHGTNLLNHPEEYDLVRTIQKFLNDGSIYQN
ncbi:MAG: hypothetical protein A3H63_01910 [Candidatus Harrisonbacteria bacterium RIFCSPLOWO2_02_FULL_45_10c]|uniref:Serine aminopeptidase S33 domain-containing protein n=1 Tax=Candidatus Harrisonbacteria bacterium RIFCSPLOWO2_02_FULL_45_10c TaxID=1798410 RepID=A0A1G1ZT20_9BACT|nr:MAG: hypothetical protein A3H63_01910 [Candidatus Harrisonbacteria bacterium RIFCSPLOWO2_02_FULL_45_10c]